MKLYIRAHDLGVKNEQPIIDRLKECGLDGVQLVAYKAFDGVEYAPGGITAQRAAQLGESLRQAGMEVALIGAYFNPVHSDGAKVERCQAIFRDYLDCAAALGCEAVGSETGSFNDDKWTYNPLNRTEEALVRVTDTFRGLCGHAADKGVRVAIEGASGHVCFDVATLKKAAEMIGRDNLDIIFDLYNYLDGTNCRDYKEILTEGIAAFAGRIRCWHIKDCVMDAQPSLSSRPTQVPVGKGELDFEFILGAIKACDPDARLVLEGTTGNDVPASAAFIREVWERV